MTHLLLKDLEITNFRSIRGRVVAPLDAKVVLVHGENGAGKTSLLSAIELALTGGIQSLRRADPGYTSQLLHRSALNGSVEIRTFGQGGDHGFRTLIDAGGIVAGETLDLGQASFFSERTYLPQSLLGQLLQIYQESGSGIDSPLARFVGGLLGLDRLDALEAGLKPLADVRNVRKIADRWSQAEIEKSRLDRLLQDQRRTRDTVVEEVETAFAELASRCAILGIAPAVSEKDLAAIERALGESSDDEALSRATDRRRQLGAIRREAQGGSGETASDDQANLAAALKRTSAAFGAWQSAVGSRIADVRTRVETLLPVSALSRNAVAFREEALTLLRSEWEQLANRLSRGETDAKRVGKARDELAVARRQLAAIDDEVSRIAANSGSLGSMLAELTSFIADDVCPVCDRDYREMEAGSLVQHARNKVRMLSTSAQRLLTLSRSRGEQQLAVERLEREIEALAARLLEPRTLVDLGRRTAALGTAISELEALGDAAAEGARLTSADVAARRALSDWQSRDLARTAARATLHEYALSVGHPGPDDGETEEAAAARLDGVFDEQVRRLSERFALRRDARGWIATVRTVAERRGRIDAAISDDAEVWARVDSALRRAQAVRDDGLSIRTMVDTVRSGIIRREFNNRLNRLWRDLFVRLAPSEPFVPAFRIPPSGTQRLQPKLITEHRDGGDSGGTPGAMLSSGNLNTAALTLFIALHLSVPAQLPWLILDDPVQSMDDVHIAQFAALLRTLAKQHGRQVMIAVHDRQLFEYLKLELSPAYPDDSLLTLELSRGARRDTICLTERLSFHEETALREAA